jgi:putative N-acetylmannosamine-6-phosphate epimerase
MSTKGEITESTIARIAGNLLSGYGHNYQTREDDHRFVTRAVHLARAIAAEVQSTAPQPDAETRKIGESLGLSDNLTVTPKATEPTT